MGMSEIILALDEEIARLRQARDLLSRGRQVAGRLNLAHGNEHERPKRVLSAAARARIAAAQRKRWAKQKAAK